MAGTDITVGSNSSPIGSTRHVPSPASIRHGASGTLRVVMMPSPRPDGVANPGSSAASTRGASPKTAITTGSHDSPALRSLKAAVVSPGVRTPSTGPTSSAARSMAVSRSGTHSIDPLASRGTWSSATTTMRTLSPKGDNAIEPTIARTRSAANPSSAEIVIKPHASRSTNTSAVTCRPICAKAGLGNAANRGPAPMSLIGTEPGKDHVSSPAIENSGGAGGAARSRCRSTRPSSWPTTTTTRAGCDKAVRCAWPARTASPTRAMRSSAEAPRSVSSSGVDASLTWSTRRSRRRGAQSTPA